MLYDVKQSQNYDRHFTVCANNDSELINAIAEAIDAECDEDYYGDITLDDFDGSIWEVRELGELSKIKLSISRKIDGERC